MFKEGVTTNPGPDVDKVPDHWWWGQAVGAEALAAARLKYDCCDGSRKYYVYGVAGGGFDSAGSPF